MSVENTIVTVGELIRVLSQYNLTAKVVFDTQGSYVLGIQITTEDVEYNEDEDTVRVLV